MTKTIELLT